MTYYHFYKVKSKKQVTMSYAFITISHIIYYFNILQKHIIMQCYLENILLLTCVFLDDNILIDAILI